LSAQALAEAAAQTDEAKALMAGQNVVKVIGVPGRLVNIVVK
jgi:leucyl-tRNA synthetase